MKQSTFPVEDQRQLPLNIHFISGLPRSGSTMLAAILRQNPAFHAAISAPTNAMFSSLARSMGPSNEAAIFVTDEVRERMLRAVFETYYADIGGKERVVFDTSRGWCGLISGLVRIFPEARFICCVRNIAWILDSLERIVQENILSPSRMFPSDRTWTVYSRAEWVMSPKEGFIGLPLSGLRQAWFGEHAQHLVAVRYEALTANPKMVIDQLYDLLEQPRFEHDFDHLEYDEPEFDARLGLPGLHKVSPRVEFRARKTILPPDIFNQHDREFWNVPGQNPRGITIL